MPTTPNMQISHSFTLEDVKKDQYSFLSTQHTDYLKPAVPGSVQVKLRHSTWRRTAVTQKSLIAARTQNIQRIRKQPELMFYGFKKLKKTKHSSISKLCNPKQRHQLRKKALEQGRKHASMRGAVRAYLNLGKTLSQEG